MFQYTKFEYFVPFGFLETELNATVNIFLYIIPSA